VNYLAHGATLALAWFLATNAVASAAVAAAARRFHGRAHLLLALRLFPAALSAAFVALVFLPSYWTFEPRDSVEGFDVTLTTLALVAAALVLVAVDRGARAWWHARQRARAWIRTGERFRLPGVGLPAFRIDASEPFMALVGIFRPRLIVSRGLVEALTPEEIAAGAAHEAAHHRAYDNFKRLAIRSAPDLLRWTAAARTLERKWAAAAEHNADRTATFAESRAVRLALASALVKVARLMPPKVIVGEPISTLVGGGAIASRVRRLVDEAPDMCAGCTLAGRWRVATAVAGAAGFAAGYVPLLQAVHRATELLVQHLP
jgi:Zn-dependent protease with chaperone function